MVETIGVYLHSRMKDENGLLQDSKECEWMKNQNKPHENYLDMSDTDLRERLEEIRSLLYENDVRRTDVKILSFEELKKLRADAYEIQRIMTDLGITFSPVKVDHPALFNFLFSLIELRSMNKCWNASGATCSCHSCR